MDKSRKGMEHPIKTICYIASSYKYSVLLSLTGSCELAFHSLVLQENKDIFLLNMHSVEAIVMKMLFGYAIWNLISSLFYSPACDSRQKGPE